MKTYFKICLWSPIWFPVLLGLLGIALHGLTGDLYALFPDWLGAAGFIVVYSLVFGGIQYLITIVFLWGLIDFDDYRSWLKWVILLPLIFTVFQLGTMLLIFVWEFDSLSDYASLGLLGLFDLGLGYAYVLIWIVGYTLLKAFNNFGEEVYQ